MPRRLSQQEVANEFQRYGYTILPDEVYRTTRSRMNVRDETTGRNTYLSLQQLRYKVSRGRAEYDFNPYEIAKDENFTKQQLSSFDRFIQKQDSHFRSVLNENQQREAFNYYQSYLKKLKGNRNFKIDFDTDTYLSQLYGLTAAMKVAGPRLPDGIRMNITNEEDTPNYLFLNSRTVQNFESLCNNTRDTERNFSEEVYMESLLDLKSITFDYTKSKPTSRRRQVGFFPYFNKSDIDLSKYAIFPNFDKNNYTDNCLVYALSRSGMFSDDVMDLIRSFVKTRMVDMSEFEEMSSFLNTSMVVKKYYPDTDKFSTSVYGEHFDQKIKLLVFNDHIMLNEKVPCSEYYINNYDKINSSRLCNHDRKRFTCKLNDKRYEFKKSGTSLSVVLKLMFKNGLFEEMPEQMAKDIDWTWIRFDGSVKRSTKTFKRIVHHDKPLTPFALDPKNKTIHFFGYTPDQDEVEFRLNQLQEFIDSIPLRHRVNVRGYFRYSELMQKVMYEFGCFDNVYSMAGDIAVRIRNDCIFHKPHLPYGVKRYYSNEKLYYVDLNSAFLSVVTGIPSGLPDEFGNFESRSSAEGGSENKKIVELINIFQKARTTADQKFKHTLKSLITSCWGYSISKPRNYKTKHVPDVHRAINEYGDRVASFRFNEDNRSGVIKVEQSFVQNYTYPQFARSVLNNYADKVNEICSIVTPLYFNIDAFLITENDYNKLVEHGMIGNEMGKLKIEKIFTEFCCVSSRKYVATLEDGTQYLHCIKKETYDEIKALSQQ